MHKTNNTFVETQADDGFRIKYLLDIYLRIKYLLDMYLKS